MTTVLPEGLLAVLGMIVGWGLGVLLADLPTKWIRVRQPLLSIPELAQESRRDALVARSFFFASMALFFGGGLALSLICWRYFPGPLDAGFTFTFFGSLACILGLGRGVYEACLGLGPDADNFIRKASPSGFLTDSREVRRRGQLRVLVCIAAIVLFFVVGAYLQTALAPLLVLVVIGYLLRVGPVHIADALNTFRQTRSTGPQAGPGAFLQALGAGVFFLFGLAQLVLAGYLLFRLGRALW